MTHSLLYPLTVQSKLPLAIDHLLDYCQGMYLGLNVESTFVTLAQRVKKKVKTLFKQIIIHLARILGETVAGRPPDHQDDPEQDRPHWWKEIKNFINQIEDEGLSEAQLRKILEDTYTRKEVDAVVEALRQASEIMGEFTPNLFQ
ncbi:hypothetical protein H6S82_24185 [Planktothrix sp. FACHB-1355]|uniref:Uncharacterized protein n=1 Tax=Aerosakkonema funiforme FACHB-1375 TaxID=2949571 RepID=A0A926VIB8_9CYAN|nr:MULTISPECIES: hypothetical protein [Oscillatoriales]MBD2184324.1 hypothetical protein [Aerosakkonema funiforme FACHB-1375]MBD3561920.1 hypothetical protein [Planktothrix sp. FACHB-1355]